MQTDNEAQSRPSGWAQAESGQVIILLAMAMVALIAFLGLAIDGAGLFFLQRNAQNATDAAMLAATYAMCAGGNSESVVNAGYEAAAQNGFANSSGRSVTVSNPPTSGEKAGDANFVEVDITANKQPIFIQVVYRGPLQVSVRSVGTCVPPFDPSKVAAVFGISNDSSCQDTVNWTGSNGSVQGDVFSNYEIKFGGGGQGNTVDGSTTAVYQVQYSSSDNNTFSTAPVYPASEQPDPLATVFQFTYFAPGGRLVRDLVPDEYYHAITSSADDEDYKGGNNTWQPKPNRMLEGVYYVEGDVNLSIDQPIGVNGITIVATGTITGNKLSVHYYSGPGSTGILFYSSKVSPCPGSDVISVSGNDTQWFGVIYAPKGGASVSGSNLTLYGDIIAESVDISGSQVSIVADPSIMAPRPALVQIAE